MGTTPYSRKARRAGPVAPAEEIALQEPPIIPEPAERGISAVLMLAPMAIASLAMVLMFLRPNAGALAYVGVMLMVLSAVAMMIVPIIRNAGQHKHRLNGERRDYLRYLGQVRRKVRGSLTEERRAARWLHPDPGALWSMALSQRLWERRTAHADFGEVRLGLGARRSTTRLVAPSSKPVEDLEPMAAHALRRFLRAYSTMQDAPIAIYLRGFSRIGFQGDLNTTRSAVRAMLAQLVVAHSPADLYLVLVTTGPHWDWAKWLPHVQDDSAPDVTGTRRRFVTDLTQLDEALAVLGVPERPGYEPDTPVTAIEQYVVVVLDWPLLPSGHRLGAEGYRNVVTLDIGATLGWEPHPHTLLVQADESQLNITSFDHLGKSSSSPLCRPDRMGTVAAGALARSLARYRVGAGGDTEEPLATDYDLAGMLQLGDLTRFDTAAYRSGRSPAQRLRVPIGMTSTGMQIELDIKEAAEGGMGPHGMLIGATGSGKSELLRTLVLALAARHSSEDLNFVLVDFKGGAAFVGFERLPHTSAVITNLSEELELVDRMQDALTGELNRRQEHLRASGYPSRREYERARSEGTAMDPMPALFIVVDEFSEMLSSKPEFIDVFAMIGRLGRSLGVHLLLASQRVDEGRIHTIEGHLSYRIGLRTFSSMESRSVLGVPDAYELPNAPGNGYLRPDTTTLIRFKAAYCSGPWRPPHQRRRQSAQGGLVPFGTEHLVPDEPATPDEDAEPDSANEKAPVMADVLLEALRGQGPAAHQVWLPPLTDSTTLEKLLPPLVEHPTLGLAPVGGYGTGQLTVPIGLVDLPAQQRRELLTASLAGSAGNVGVVGGPQSGKSTLLRTLITALALTHTAAEVQFYCLDFGGGALASLARLPHVGGVTGRLDRDKVTRTVLEVTNLLAHREQIFSQNGIDSMTSYRRARRTGAFQDVDPYGDVFLIVDGWYTARQDFQELDDRFGEIAARGLGFGVHLVVSAGRWTEIRPWLRDVLGTRFELKLGDPVESEVHSRTAATVPNIPGRGITADRQHFLGALPRIDGNPDTEDLAEATAELVESLDVPSAPRAPLVKLLPDRLPVTMLPAATAPSKEAEIRIPLGLDDVRLEPLWHDFDANPHLLIFGDTETGKTNLLRHIARSIAAHHTPKEARIVFGDFRRELHDAIPQVHQIGYSMSAERLAATMAEAGQILTGRLPGPEIPPSRLAKRDWWTGGRMFILVDDFELIESGRDSPLAPLLPLLPHGAEIGLHLIIARSTSGANRGMMNPVLRRAWDLGSPGLLLSCPREEGSFLGNVKPRVLPVARGQYIDRRRSVRLVQTPEVPMPERPED
ncbi:type VII secretion protein EccCa [Actinoplanes derwentensis]|uniref:DNA segregation ATPase FtsK/SpoIIIE, S-DNA-T family n=1 Tax=Actinoplanes derwentensis TaxID=113562 RepID=A0A1H2C7K0_9ACTN|nr:type VII secretion protein EccCa [Actinoplanes derwentensis]GID86543.1 type VII secretion protein EccC [Actinoplanes derwentensis]SDT66498.1 DNA segregation ATPase FtsK/SpoIIIE, S-DNA-T family [Actinoplanes derwentensis]